MWGEGAGRKGKVEEWLITGTAKGNLGKLAQYWLLNETITQFPISYNMDAQLGSWYVGKPYLEKHLKQQQKPINNHPLSTYLLCKHGFPYMKYMTNI